MLSYRSSIFFSVIIMLYSQFNLVYGNDHSSFVVLYDISGSMPKCDYWNFEAQFAEQFISVLQRSGDAPDSIYLFGDNTKQHCISKSDICIQSSPNKIENVPRNEMYTHLKKAIDTIAKTKNLENINVIVLTDGRSMSKDCKSGKCPDELAKGIESVLKDKTLKTKPWKSFSVVQFHPIIDSVSNEKSYLEKYKNDYFIDTVYNYNTYNDSLYNRLIGSQIISSIFSNIEKIENLSAINLTDVPNLSVNSINHSNVTTEDSELQDATIYVTDKKISEMLLPVLKDNLTFMAKEERQSKHFCPTYDSLINENLQSSYKYIVNEINKTDSKIKKLYENKAGLEKRVTDSIGKAVANIDIRPQQSAEPKVAHMNYSIENITAEVISRKTKSKFLSTFTSTFTNSKDTIFTKFFPNTINYLNKFSLRIDLNTLRDDLTKDIFYLPYRIVWENYSYLVSVKNDINSLESNNFDDNVKLSGSEVNDKKSKKTLEHSIKSRNERLLILNSNLTKFTGISGPNNISKSALNTKLSILNVFGTLEEINRCGLQNGLTSPVNAALISDYTFRVFHMKMLSEIRNYKQNKYESISNALIEYNKTIKNFALHDSAKIKKYIRSVLLPLDSILDLPQESAFKSSSIDLGVCLFHIYKELYFLNDTSDYEGKTNFTDDDMVALLKFSNLIQEGKYKSAIIENIKLIEKLLPKYVTSSAIFINNISLIACIIGASSEEEIISTIANLPSLPTHRDRKKTQTVALSVLPSLSVGYICDNFRLRDNQKNFMTGSIPLGVEYFFNCKRNTVFSLYGQLLDFGNLKNIDFSRTVAPGVFLLANIPPMFFIGIGFDAPINGNSNNHDYADVRFVSKFGLNIDILGIMLKNK